MNDSNMSTSGPVSIKRRSFQVSMYEDFHYKDNTITIPVLVRWHIFIETEPSSLDKVILWARKFSGWPGTYEDAGPAGLYLLKLKGRTPDTLFFFVKYRANTQWMDISLPQTSV